MPWSWRSLSVTNAETPELSDRQIARQIGATHPFVGNIRNEMKETGQLSTVDTSKGSDGKERPRQTQRKPVTVLNIPDRKYLPYRSKMTDCHYGKVHGRNDLPNLGQVVAIYRRKGLRAVPGSRPSASPPMARHLAPARLPPAAGYTRRDRRLCLGSL